MNYLIFDRKFLKIMIMIILRKTEAKPWYPYG